MTEFWVSQGRKFCTFCKCWLSDNKPSIEFHERGKRHQDSVQNKITELKKKGCKDAKEKQDMERSMSYMEKAAMEAFKKDLMANPDLAKQYGVKPQVEGPSLPPTQSLQEAAEEEETVESSKVLDWHEAKSPDGHFYYWNIKTKATTWDKPKEYKSFEEQKIEKEKKTLKRTKDKKPKSQIDDNSQPTSKVVHTSKAKFVLHKKKEMQLTHNFDEGTKTDISEEHQQLRKSQAESRLNMAPYGSWAPVQSAVVEPDDDLNLPVSSKPADPPLPVFVEENPAVPKFKEKTVSSLGKNSNEAVAFKKRKVGTAVQNARKRIEQD